MFWVIIYFKLVSPGIAGRSAFSLYVLRHYAKNPNRKLPANKTVFDGFLAYYWLPCVGDCVLAQLIGPEIYQSRILTTHATLLKIRFFD